MFRIAGPSASVASGEASLAEWTAKPLGIDDATPYGVTARQVTAMVEGTFSDNWPATSGLGSAELTIKYTGGPLKLEQRTQPKARIEDRDGDGVDDYSLRIVIPVSLLLTAADGALVVHADSATLHGTSGTTAGLQLWLTFAKLQPPFDPARILEPSGSSCDLGVLSVYWKDKKFAGLELFPRRQTAATA